MGKTKEEIRAMGEAVPADLPTKNPLSPFRVQRKPNTSEPCSNGWVGGDQKGPSILLIFKNDNKQGVLTTNAVSKVVSRFLYQEL